MRITQKINAERRESQAKARFRRAVAAYDLALKRQDRANAELSEADEMVFTARKLRDEAQAELLAAVARKPR